MILTQPKLTAMPNGRSIMSVTTYQPSNSECDPEGHSYLMLADAFTGLPAPYMADYGFDSSDNGFELDGKNGTLRQVTGYLSAGRGLATESWVLRGVSGITIGGASMNQVHNKVFVPSAVDGNVTGALWWREVSDMGFNLDLEQLQRGLP
jgi:hypothetical protein